MDKLNINFLTLDRIKATNKKIDELTTGDQLTHKECLALLEYNSEIKNMIEINKDILPNSAEMINFCLLSVLFIRSQISYLCEASNK